MNDDSQADTPPMTSERVSDDVTSMELVTEEFIELLGSFLDNQDVGSYRIMRWAREASNSEPHRKWMVFAMLVIFTRGMIQDALLTPRNVHDALKVAYEQSPNGESKEAVKDALKLLTAAGAVEIDLSKNWQHYSTDSVSEERYCTLVMVMSVMSATIAPLAYENVD